MTQSGTSSRPAHAGQSLPPGNPPRAGAPRAGGPRRRHAASILVAGILVAGVVALLCLPALAQSPAPEFAPREEEPAQFPAGAGRDETFYACTACHNFKLVAAQGMTRRQWDNSITWMSEKHNMPPLDAKDRETILGYLEATFPPRAPAGRGGWQIRSSIDNGAVVCPITAIDP